MTMESYRDHLSKCSKDELIQEAIYCSLETGKTSRDENRLAHIEAILRDALGQNHGVWRWRLGNGENNDQ